MTLNITMSESVLIFHVLLFPESSLMRPKMTYNNCLTENQTAHQQHRLVVTLTLLVMTLTIVWPLL